MRSRQLRQPHFKKVPPCAANNLDPFQLPHHGPAHAQSRLRHQLLEGFDAVLFNNHELRLYKPNLCQSALLVDCFPRIPVRNMQVHPDLEHLLEDAETSLLEGLLFLDCRPFQIAERDWLAGLEFFPSDRTDIEFPSPMVPLFRMGRITLQKRLECALSMLA